MNLKLLNKINPNDEESVNGLFWDLAAAARLLKTSEARMRQYVRDGEIAAFLVGGKYLIEQGELYRFLKKCEGRSSLAGRPKEESADVGGD